MITYVLWVKIEVFAGRELVNHPSIIIYQPMGPSGSGSNRSNLQNHNRAPGGAQEVTLLKA